MSTERQTWRHLRGVLNGFWQGSINVCRVHDDVRVLLVQWYDGVHMGEELIVLDGRLIDLHCTQALILLATAGASPSATASYLAMCQIRSTMQQE